MKILKEDCAQIFEFLWILTTYGFQTVELLWSFWWIWNPLEIRKIKTSEKTISYVFQCMNLGPHLRHVLKENHQAHIYTASMRFIGNQGKTYLPEREHRHPPRTPGALHTWLKCKIIPLKLMPLSTANMVIDRKKWLSRWCLYVFLCGLCENSPSFNFRMRRLSRKFVFASF